MGQTLVWIAMPQFLVCVLAAMTLRRIDARFSASAGFICVAVSCLIVAHGLTSVWGEDQFWPALLLQAIGQSFAMTGIIFYNVQHTTPATALTLGGFLQTTRVMGGEVGQAFIVTFVRIRSQIADNLIGLHVQTGDSAVGRRIGLYEAATSRLGDTSAALPRGASLLGDAVRQAATTQAIIDAFLVMAVFAALGTLLLMALKAPPPNPAAPHLLRDPLPEGQA
jgi:DHA2 family multidrug resistance protein